MQGPYDHNLGTIKLTIPPLQGKNDPEVYVEWKVELVFDCHNYFVLIKKKQKKGQRKKKAKKKEKKEEVRNN